MFATRKISRNFRFVQSRQFSLFDEKLPKHKYILSKKSYRLAHPYYSLQDIEKVETKHREPNGLRDKIAYNTVKGIRSTFDWFTGYKPEMGEAKWLNRMIFLETVAGIPGMIGGMMRHLRSLRTMKHDGGWIHHLLEEAENERMHLFTFLELKQPSLLFKMAIMAGQGIMFWGYGLFYLITPKTCHRFVGYLEEEAVLTYTKCIAQIDSGSLQSWKQKKASEAARVYWRLPENATVRDVILSIRADQVVHREVNHHFSGLPPTASMEQEQLKVDDIKYPEQEDLLQNKTEQKKQN